MPFTLKTVEEIAEKQKDELEQQAAALKSFSTDLANDIKSAMVDGRQELIRELHSATNAFSSAITEQLEPTFNNLNIALEELRKQKEESSTDAIQQLVEEFQKSLSGSATAQMEALAETVNKASESLITLPEQLASMMVGVQDQVNQTRQLLSKTSEGQMDQMKIMMDGIVSTFQNLLESAAERADAQLAQRMTDMETISTQSIHTLQTAIIDLQQGLTQTAAQTTEGSGEMITRMRELLESAANRTNEQLAKRISDIETASSASIQTLQIAITQLQKVHDIHRFASYREFGNDNKSDASTCGSECC